jgi:hypothetical protein
VDATNNNFHVGSIKGTPEKRGSFLVDEESFR